MLKRSQFLTGVILITAALLTYFKIPVANSQGLQLVVSRTQGDLPLEEPFSPLWDEAPAVEVPLSAQNVARPFLMETRIKSVTARALHNDARLAVLLEWSDASQDDQTVAVQDFTDAVALQFPLAAGQPFFCMGQPGGNVSIWHWKADWQSDLIARREMEIEYPHMYVDMYPFADAAEDTIAKDSDYADQNYLTALAAGNPFADLERASPVENLIAGGFGSLTSRPVEAQSVQGYGEWQDGRWRVILSRNLDTSDVDDVQFVSGNIFSIAFAVWDGANNERNGQKSTSQWVAMQLEAGPQVAPPPAAPAATQPVGWIYSDTARTVIIAGTVLVILAVIIIAVLLPE